jgi:RNA polymerase sigma factor (sigma-70 family)
VSPTRSDADLLRAARKDADAFAVFYRAHVAWVERWLRGQVRDPHVAADLTAETFAQALLSLARFRGREPGEGTAWLFGIARNLLRGYLARRRVETDARDRLGIAIRDYAPDEFAAADERMDASALAAEIAAAVGSLPADLRETLELRALDGLPYDEIAARTGTTAANARMRVARAVRTAGARLARKREPLL